MRHSSPARAARAAAVCAVLALGTAFVPPGAGTVPGEPSAVFVQSNGTEGNAVVAYERAHDGTLTRRGVHPTGGLGGALDGTAGTLAAQGSLTYDPGHDLLYAVNAGSDSLTVFRVHGARLERVQVIGSGGDFPVSVTAHGDRVYVLNALGGGSVQGFAYESGRLTRLPRTHRDLGLDPTAAPQPRNTPAQIGFTPDGSGLLVTTRGDGDEVLHFRVDPYGRPAARPVATELPGAVPSGFAFDRGGRLVLAEEGPGAVAVLEITPGGALRRVSERATGQPTTRWVARGGHIFYASNADGDTVSVLRGERSGRLEVRGTTPTAAGTRDAAVSPDARHLYVRTGAAGTVDAFAIGRDGTLTPVASVRVPEGTGGEGIAVV